MRRRRDDPLATAAAASRGPVSAGTTSGRSGNHNPGR